MTTLQWLATMVAALAQIPSICAVTVPSLFSNIAPMACAAQTSPPPLQIRTVRSSIAGIVASLRERLRGHFITPPARTANITVKQKFRRAAGLGCIAELPKTSCTRTCRGRRRSVEEQRFAVALVLPQFRPPPVSVRLRLSAAAYLPHSFRPSSERFPVPPWRIRCSPASGLLRLHPWGSGLFLPGHSSCSSCRPLQPPGFVRKPGALIRPLHTASRNHAS